MSPVLIAALGFSVLVALVTGSALSWWFVRTSPEQRRIRSLSAGPVGVGRRSNGESLLQDALDPTLARLSRLAPKSAKEMGQLQRRLAKAGYFSAAAVAYFSLAQLGIPILIAGAIFLFLGVGGWLYALFGAAVGYVLPGVYVSRKTAERQKAIQNGLADALDLLTVCVEAGSGIDQAIIKTSEELHITHPVVAGEFRLISTETRAGKPRLEAFQNFARRTGVEDVRSLAAMLAQTDRFGTSIGQALRGHADSIRTKRRQRAEERAAKVGVKLVFPLALCLFPALYIVCFGPVVVRVFRAFF